MFRLTKRILRHVSIKDQIQKRMAEFVTIDQGAVLRNTPTTKQRKYKNIQIAEDFKKMDSKRRKQRYENMKKMQILLEKRIAEQSNLLSAPQATSLKSQLTELTTAIEATQKQLDQLTTVLQNTQATHMLVEGYLKLTITNQIKYMQYLHTHNPGYTLNPQTIAAIENIHYCINHNLPVNRMKVFEIMPELFKDDIGELEESAQRLVLEKKIYLEDQDALTSIRFFSNGGALTSPAQNAEAETQLVFDNMFYYLLDVIGKHGQLLSKVQTGKTPFRNIEHLLTVMLSNMPIKYLPEEQALKKDIEHALQIKEEWQNFRKAQQQQIHRLKFSPVEPPPYVKGHPLLMKYFQLAMKDFTNPVDFQKLGVYATGDLTQVKLGQKMRQQIRKVVSQKYDPLFIQAMNSDRSKIDKKKLEIQFYNLSTNIMQNLLALQQKPSDTEQFKKLPKDSGLISSRKKNRIPADHLTRMIFLNSKNKDKYNLDFFSLWAGVDKQDLKAVLEGISYLKVPLNNEGEKSQEQIKIDILKFQF